MFNGDGLRERTGPAPRLIEGPKTGQPSLYHQQVLDEDAYTEALSRIIGRDFFPNLPHLNATNEYLSALADNDPEKLSASIRKLARLAQEKEEGRSPGGAESSSTARRRAMLDNSSTPYISRPGDAGRIPLGARGWETPKTVRRPREAEDALDFDLPGPSRPKRRRPAVRDDLSLDAFQRNYTSEDNASFVHIIEEENRQRKEERNAWAFEQERVAEDRRLEGEARRKMILDAATSGGWRVDANGRRLIGGLAQGGSADSVDGEAWRERKAIAAPPDSRPSVEADEDSPKDASGPSTALVKPQSGGALIKSTDASSASALPPPVIQEEELPSQHPLSKALVQAGLPPTALVSTKDGAIVPQHESASGAGDGRGRGEEEQARRAHIEKEVMGGDERDGGGKVEQWPYKAMNGLMFPPDAYVKPYPVPNRDRNAKPSANPPSISHRNTRIADEEEDNSRAESVRGTSVAESWVDRAITGTSRRGDQYPLLAEEEELDPEDLPPLMTWGTLLGTPRVHGADGSDPLDLSGPSFRMPETKRRDDIGRKLGTQASRAMSDRTKAYLPRPAGSSTLRLSDTLRAAADRTRAGDRSARGAMPPPQSTPRREGNLTPAARSLLDRSLGRTPRGGGGGLGLSGSSARARSAAMEKGSGWGGGARGARSWTPSPAPRRDL